MSTPDAPAAPEGWFPTGKLDLGGWRFDVITLLAVIGEASVAVHAQTLTASTLCLLPRLIPAPQALLKGVRPRRLPEVTAKMAGVYGGTVLDSVGFFANILHQLDDLDAFAFQVWEIKHKEVPLRKEGGEGWWERALRWRPRGRGKGTKGSAAAGKGAPLEGISEDMGVDLESGPRTPPTPGTAPNGPAAFPDVAPDQPPGLQLPDDDPIQPGVEVQDGETQAQNDKDGIKPLKHRSQRQGSRFDRATDTVAGIGGEVKKEKGNETKMERYAVPPAFWSPLHVVSVLSFAMTVAIFIVAGYWEDGTAMLAIFFLSAASSVTCWASWWRPLLMNRPDNRVPKGDVVIRTRAGAFVLIKCREEVVRELYSGTEECKYVVGDNYYRILMGLGMVLLMVAVVLLGNCGWNSQALIGASYIILNAVYWGLGLLPSSYFWDLDRYTMKDITPKDAVDAHIVPKLAIKDVERLPSFTRTLWYAIRETEKVAWVERSGAMPMTDAWKKWLDEASAAAREARSAVREGKDVPKWPAVGRKNKILQEAEAEDADKTMKTTTSWSTAGTSSVTHRRPYEAAREVAPAETVQPSRAEPSSGTF